MAYFKRNFGGWPVTEKWVFDAAARRRANKAHDRLSHAKEHIERTFGGEWATPSEFTEPYRNSAAAWDILNAAASRVTDAEVAAHSAAKAVNGY